MLAGLLGLFATAFLAGSVVPAPSEAALLAVLGAGVTPALAIAVATLGNVLGACSVYLLGRLAAAGGGPRLRRWVERHQAPASPRAQRAAAAMRRHGAPALLLSWLPFVGDALVFAAGALEMRATAFLFFVALGKALRYVAITLAAGAAGLGS